ncbi:uncharacterized protein K452DRAFT_242897 [Aplosporella prunicola CBS 121167]|uniref:Prolyl 4-hydroxylase alpha subunit domain-containing protein n=1 Tax=Aplosporella prunicola CBS 121167 TaxID=1176127 RepID=A0A6A6BUC1_9PEZI|nr:uncharacterized protein K452DRAFT_242897 [Aplosporella prunicola CBS 121167]KAF2146241.1 hypothetical protein K452DRAFT_242897 [Aplosporella prunicola CBS 121167]
MSSTQTPLAGAEPKIPQDFLAGPAPANMTCEHIDFANSPVPKYAGMYAVVLDNVLTPEECATLVALAEARTGGKWERAMINVGGGKQALMTDERNCGRIIWDDVLITDRIWNRVKGRVPEVLALEGTRWAQTVGPRVLYCNETWCATRLNERMRFLKYTGGEYFRPHMDGAYVTPDNKERSFMTFHLYLNDASTTAEGEEPLEGGATTLHSPDTFMMMDGPEEYKKKGRLDIVPKVGRVLLFQHRNLVHSGDDVVKGTKITMRTDLMYRCAGED